MSHRSNLRSFAAAVTAIEHHPCATTSVRNSTLGATGNNNTHFTAQCVVRFGSRFGGATLRPYVRRCTSAQYHTISAVIYNAVRVYILVPLRCPAGGWLVGSASNGVGVNDGAYATRIHTCARSFINSRVRRTEMLNARTVSVSTSTDPYAAGFHTHQCTCTHTGETTLCTIYLI